ncbi:hypothetical protein EDB83DRAFT_1161381 [Lactarius deliciosus]|nr:hypothetical protein EDB83DRAFT_1161381 [Lactarius deliciosus]
MWRSIPTTSLTPGVIPLTTPLVVQTMISAISANFLSGLFVPSLSARVNHGNFGTRTCVSTTYTYTCSRNTIRCCPTVPALIFVSSHGKAARQPRDYTSSDPLQSMIIAEWNKAAQAAQWTGWALNTAIASPSSCRRDGPECRIQRSICCGPTPPYFSVTHICHSCA